MVSLFRQTPFIKEPHFDLRERAMEHFESLQNEEIPFSQVPVHADTQEVIRSLKKNISTDRSKSANRQIFLLSLIHQMAFDLESKEEGFRETLQSQSKLIQTLLQCTRFFKSSYLLVNSENRKLKDKAERIANTLITHKKRNDKNDQQHRAARVIQQAWENLKKRKLVRQALLQKAIEIQNIQEANKQKAEAGRLLIKDSFRHTKTMMADLLQIHLWATERHEEKT